MKKYIFLLFLLCGCVAVFAQQKSTFTVSGQVFDGLFHGSCHGREYGSNIHTSSWSIKI